MKKSELEALIKDILQPSLKDQVEDALKPYVEQQTEWFEQIKSAQRAAHGRDEPKPEHKGIGAARFIRAITAGRGDPGRALHFAKKAVEKGAWNDSMGEAIVRALQAGDLEAGGVFVPPEFSAEIIELLRARTVVRAAGARILPMTSGSLTMRRHTGSATASYTGESTNISTSEPTTGELTLTAKKLAALVPISNDLLRFDSGNTTDEFVRDDLVDTIADREDRAFLRDDGTANTPKGLRFWAAAANLLTSAGTSANNAETDFKSLAQQLETSDVRLRRPVWFMSPRESSFLRTAREGTNGNLIFPEFRSGTATNGQIFGWPVFTTTNIPTNLTSGGGTAESEVYFVDMADVIIAESMALEIAVDSSASYVDSGSLVSAFQRDETLIRAITRHDLGVRHPEAVAVMTDADWAA